LKAKIAGRLFAVTLLVLFFGGIDSVAQGPPPPLPGNQRFAVPQPSPARTTPVAPRAPRRPIPRKYVIPGAAVAAFISLFLLSRALGHWHRSNLFDRAYRFPVRGDAAFRLGARRSGGRLAQITFKKTASDD
jgi:hypothetical protein